MGKDVNHYILKQRRFTGQMNILTESLGVRAPPSPSSLVERVHFLDSWVRN